MIIILVPQLDHSDIYIKIIISINLKIKNYFFIKITEIIIFINRYDLYDNYICALT